MAYLLINACGKIRMGNGLMAEGGEVYVNI